MPRVAKSWCCGLGFSKVDEDCEELTRNVDVVGKVVVVGDGLVGKTCLLMRYVHGHFPEEYQATIFENEAVKVDVDKKKVLLTIFDTAGQEGYEALRPLMYSRTDVIVMCFAIDNRDSLDNVTGTWQPDVRQHLPKTPIILVGLKTDLRTSFANDNYHHNHHLHADPPQDRPLSSPVRSSMSQPLIRDSGEVFEMEERLPNSNSPAQRCVSYSEGQKLAEQIGAKAYFECSAKLNQGLTAIFYEAAQLALKKRGSTLRKLSNSLSRRSRSWRAST